MERTTMAEWQQSPAGIAAHCEWLRKRQAGAQQAMDITAELVATGCAPPTTHQWTQEQMDSFARSMGWEVC